MIKQSSYPHKLSLYVHDFIRKNYKPFYTELMNVFSNRIGSELSEQNIIILPDSLEHNIEEWIEEREASTLVLFFIKSGVSSTSLFNHDELLTETMNKNPNLLVFKINDHEDINNIENLISLSFQKDFAEWDQLIAKKLQYTAKKIKQKLSDFSEDKIEHYEENFTPLDNSLSFEDLTLSTESCLKKVFKKSTIEMKDVSEIEEKDLIYDIIKASPLETDKKVFIIKNELNDEQTLLLKAILSKYQELCLILSESMDNEEATLLKKSFDNLPLPISIFNERFELFLHNESFSRMNILPKDCLKFSDGDTSAIDDRTYKILRNEFYYNDEKFSLFIFNQGNLGEDFEDPGSSRELGIIASSIAHELNNPIAGILAALTVIKLEDNLSEETLSLINEMNKGADRCKHLVNTFLGFSRASMNTNEELTIPVAIEQALSLIRFRLIETRYQFDFSVEIKSAAFKLKTSVLSMVLYLIFNEILTGFSHYLLLIGKNDSRQIKGQIISDYGELSISIENRYDFETYLKGNNLIKFFLKIENLGVAIEGQKIVIKKN